jgi:hypothetical protein
LAPLKLLSDPSAWGVVLGNALSAYMALTQGWSLGELMWVFWIQSIIIGLINIVRIMSVREFENENGNPAKARAGATFMAKISACSFFAVHYGFFHVVYAIFLTDFWPLEQYDAAQIQSVLVCAGGFLAAHVFSFAHNVRRDFQAHKPKLGRLFFYPYIRIIPMHLTILIGTVLGAQGMMVLFLLLKTGADVGMHAVERRLFRGPDLLHMRD